MSELNNEKRLSETVAELITDITHGVSTLYGKGYSDGKETGYSLGYSKGAEDGRKSEYDSFWDVYQDRGNRTNYKAAFHEGWNEDIFIPKYDIKPTDCSIMFANSNIVDLAGCLKRLGITLDTSNCTILTQMFQGAKTKYIPTLDVRKCTSMAYAFNSSDIETIEKLIVSESTALGTSIQNARNLKNIVIEGVFATNVSFSSCSKLTVDSLRSILAALKDLSGTGKTFSCTIGSTNLAKLTTAEKEAVKNKGWTLS